MRRSLCQNLPVVLKENLKDLFITFSDVTVEFYQESSAGATDKRELLKSKNESLTFSMNCS